MDTASGPIDEVRETIPGENADTVNSSNNPQLGTATTWLNGHGGGYGSGFGGRIMLTSEHQSRSDQDSLGDYHHRPAYQGRPGTYDDANGLGGHGNRPGETIDDSTMRGDGLSISDAVMNIRIGGSGGDVLYSEGLHRQISHGQEPVVRTTRYMTTANGREGGEEMGPDYRTGESMAKGERGGEQYYGIGTSGVYNEYRVPPTIPGHGVAVPDVGFYDPPEVCKIAVQHSTERYQIIFNTALSILTEKKIKRQLRAVGSEEECSIIEINRKYNTGGGGRLGTASAVGSIAAWKSLHVMNKSDLQPQGVPEYPNDVNGFIARAMVDCLALYEKLEKEEKLDPTIIGKQDAITSTAMIAFRLFLKS